METFLERTFWNNTVYDYLIASGFVLLSIVLIQAFRRVVLKRLQKWAESTETNVDDFVVNKLDKFGIPALYIAVIYVGLSFLTYSERLDIIIQRATTIAITVLVIRFVSSIFFLILQSFVKKQSDGEEKLKKMGGLMILINITIWIIGLLFLFSNMGYDVTAVIAGLGIGGIAVALAAQNILGDLFNYFVIFLDKPFEVGDFIILDEKRGVVEHIGIKTTRIKSLTGEQLILANSDLTGSRIHNFKRMQRRRVVFNIQVVYQTSYENIKRIPGLIKEIILEQKDQVEFDRSHFAAYGESSLNFEVVYFVLDSSYNIFMDIQQKVNLRIYQEFEKLGIEFAFPTRTLYINNPKPEEDKGLLFMKLNKGNNT